MTGVYFIVAPSLQMVKIGRASNVWSRLRCVQTNSPVLVELRALLPGGAEEEAKLHQRFAAWRVRGEWFALSDEIEAFLSDHTPPAKPQDGRATRWAQVG